jgi:hypothetical protein
MPGLVTFDSLAAALRAGFQVFDRTETGYLVRIRTATAALLDACRDELARERAESTQLRADLSEGDDAMCAVVRLRVALSDAR